MRQLLSLLFRHSPVMAGLAVLAGAVGGLANAALIALINSALHRGTAAADPRQVAAFVALCLMLPITQAFSTWVLTRLTQRSTLRLRVDLSRRILSAPLRRLEEVGAYRLQAALTEDVASIVVALSDIPLLAVQVAVVAGCLGYLGWLSVKALLAVVVVLAVGIVTYQLPLAAGMRFQRKGRANVDRLYDHFRAVTGGVKELQLHRRRRDALVDSLEATAAGNHYWGVRAATLFSAAAGWGQLVILGTIGAVVFALPLLGPVSPATLTGYALILLYMMGPLDVIMNTLPAFTRAQVSLDQIETLGLSLGGGGSAGPLPAPAAAWRTLELAGVIHAYHREDEDDAFTLGPVDLSFAPGEVVFITGGNGSGKTTLAKLIVGLYAPEGGELRLDGVPVTAAGREAYQEHFAVVFTDFFLFDRLLGIEAAGLDERAARYLSRLQLEHKVRVEGGRLSTTELSQGQRKRLALLTAYLEDRPIYLFDEWAADQDPVFKAVFYRQLLPELRARGKTVLVISHDDHYYGAADRVVKMEYGRVEYDGPPSGLPGGAPALPALAAAVPAFAPAGGPVSGPAPPAPAPEPRARFPGRSPRVRPGRKPRVIVPARAATRPSRDRGEHLLGRTPDVQDRPGEHAARQPVHALAGAHAAERRWSAAPGRRGGRARALPEPRLRPLPLPRGLPGAELLHPPPRGAGRVVLSLGGLPGAPRQRRRVLPALLPAARPAQPPGQGVRAGEARRAGGAFRRA